MWQNLRTLNKTKLKNLTCEKLKTQNVKNSNFDKTEKLKIWQNWKTQILTKLKILKYNQTKKIELRQNFKKSNCDKTY